MPSPLANTGIKGLDDIIGGGLPRNRTYLVQGQPGSGKTTLSLQFLLAGMRGGETSLYVTLSESREEIEGVAASHGWSLAGLEIIELSSIADLIDTKMASTMLHPAEIDLQRTIQRVMTEIDRLRPHRIVFDSLAELRLLAQDPLRYRRQLLGLKQDLARRRATVLLLDDRAAHGDDLQVQSIVHGVVSLERLANGYGTVRRRMIVDKLRGVGYRTGYHDYQIIRGGCVIFPRLVAAEHHVQHDGPPLSSGIEGLDTMLVGGIERGSSLLLLGPAGAGKSSIATCFIHQACARGEKVVLWGFEETNRIMLDRSAGLRRDLAPFVAAGNLVLRQVDAAEVSPGELSAAIRDDVERGGVKLIVIDSLSGYLASMPAEEHLHLHLHELLTYLNQQGVVTILTMAQHGLIGSMRSADISYIADAVLLLRFFEAFGAIKKAISVIKKRTGGHQETIREFSLAGGQVRVGEPLDQFQGVLSGTPSYHGNADGILPKPA